MSTIISPPFPPTLIFDRLLLGTLWSARQMQVTGDARNIGLIVNCTDETIPRIPHVGMIQLGLQDGYEVPAGKIEYAVRVLREFLGLMPQRKVLVCCHASRSRSAAIVLAYLLSIGMSLEEAEKYLQNRHPMTHIAPAILKSVRQYFGYAPQTVEDFIQATEWKETRVQ